MTVEDVDTVYRTALLGPSGQNDLVPTRESRRGWKTNATQSPWRSSLKPATQERFTRSARRCLEQLYAPVVGDAPGLVADILEVLVHDGYLEDGDDGFRFPSRLLKDWWSARFRDHYIPLEERRGRP